MDALVSSSRSISPAHLLDPAGGEIRPKHHTPRIEPVYVDRVTDLSRAIVTSERAVVERFSRVAGMTSTQALRPAANLSATRMDRRSAHATSPGTA
jgi:hypothetical protein